MEAEVETWFPYICNPYFVLEIFSKKQPVSKEHLLDISEVKTSDESKSFEKVATVTAKKQSAEDRKTKMNSNFSLKN